jgi:hypothetical protein
MLIFTLIFFFVITLSQLIISGTSAFTLIFTITTLALFTFLLFSFLPGSTFNLNEIEKQLYQQQSTTLESLPQEYYNDYIKVNQTQSKTINHYYQMYFDQSTDSLSIDVPEVDVYSWSTDESKYIKNNSITFTDFDWYYITISHGNNSTTFRGITGSFFLDKQNVPWLFPIHEGTSYNITYTVDLRNFMEPGRYNNTIFVMPFKEQSFTHNYTIQVKEGPKIDLWIILFFVGISVGVACLAIGIWYDNRITRRELERRRSRRQSIESMRNSSRNHFGDYSLFATTTKDDALAKVNDFRNQGYFTKIINRPDGQCDFWISNWKREQVESYGIPRWRRRNH